jgi:hypothetical protein
MQNPALVGRRYFVLEDDYLIASALADLLASQGAEVCGPVSNLADAAAALRGGRFGRRVAGYRCTRADLLRHF